MVTAAVHTTATHEPPRTPLLPMFVDWQSLAAIALLAPRYLRSTYLRRGDRPNGETA